MEQISPIQAAKLPRLNPEPTNQATKSSWADALQKAIAQLPEPPLPAGAGIPKETQRLFEYQKRVSAWQVNVELVTRVVDAGLGMVRKVQQGNL